MLSFFCHVNSLPSLCDKASHTSGLPRTNITQPCRSKLFQGVADSYLATDVSEHRVETHNCSRYCIVKMSNLCHNCTMPHLPHPCQREMMRCDICQALGHIKDFCPWGIHTLDPGYVYSMMCHNCGFWHLPFACRNRLHYCTTCGNGGHMEAFCPINATAGGLAGDGHRMFMIDQSPQSGLSQGKLEQFSPRQIADNP